ncbi:hypothetical protein, partial [uncultured Roseovarius sp.]|uniref:hypothetical protein n=1 Tax=uncultured Roseovarius sp. TaxID=293344 RepID=UPI0026311B1A
MSESVDIKDRESLEAWLKDQPRESAVWIAFRAAARVLPVWWDAVLTEEWARERDLTALLLRSVLISSVAAVVPTDDIRANVAANNAAHFNARGFANAAGFAANAATAAANANAANAASLAAA